MNEDVLSDPVNAWESAMDLQVAVPRFVVRVLREIFVVFPALKQIQISALAFKALMVVTLKDNNNICVSSIDHPN